MKVLRRVGNLTVEVEADNQVGLFEQLADVDKSYKEVFGESTCGHCGGTDISFSYRDADYVDQKTKKTKKARYYEMVCNNRKCWAKLSFGQHQEGDTLFPKRKLDDDTYDKAHRGWKKFVKDQQPVQQKESNKDGDDNIPV